MNSPVSQTPGPRRAKTVWERIRDWPIIEIVLATIIGILYSCAWAGLAIKPEDKVEQRTLAATTVGGAITGALTVAGILLSAALIGLQVIQSLPPATKIHVKYAALWSCLSLVIGTVALALLPSRVGRYDVASDPVTTAYGVLQLFLMSMSAFRLFAAVFAGLK